MITNLKKGDFIACKLSALKGKEAHAKKSCFNIDELIIFITIYDISEKDFDFNDIYLVLEYLGNDNFKELITGSIITSGYYATDCDLFCGNKTDTDEIIKAKSHPLAISGDYTLIDTDILKEISELKNYEKIFDKRFSEMRKIISEYTQTLEDEELIEILIDELSEKAQNRFNETLDPIIDSLEENATRENDYLNSLNTKASLIYDKLRGKPKVKIQNK